MKKSLCLLVAMSCIFGLSFIPTALGQDEPLPDIGSAKWLWLGPAPVAIGEWECYTRKSVTLDAKPVSAQVLITADNVYELFVNGKHVGEDGGADSIYWQSVEKYDITEVLTAGQNVIAARGKSLGGSAGLIFAVRIELEGGRVINLQTDETWPVRQMFDEGWDSPGYVEKDWKKAHIIGKMGVAPWGQRSYPNPVSPASINILSLMEIGPDFQWPAGMVFVRGFVPLTEPDNFTVSVLGSSAYFEHDAPNPVASGRQLYTLIPASPDGKLTMIHDAGKGLIASPSVSFDGTKIFFSMVPEGDHFFRVFSINLDGTDLTQLTSGPFHDYDPVQLPEGRIAFCSTRIGSRDEYHGNLATSIFSMEPDGSDITAITYHIVADHEPTVTSDGAIAFIRSDNFFERAKVETRIQQVRPDGTGSIVILGADRQELGFDTAYAAERNSSWLRINGYGTPAALADGRVAAVSNHGLVASGRFDAGYNTHEKISTTFVPYDISPLPDGRLLCTSLNRTWIGIFDNDTGKVAKITTMDTIHSPAYIGPRYIPPVRAHRINSDIDGSPDQTGFLLCQTVFNTKQNNADWTRTKAVRILEGKPFAFRSTKHRFVHLGVEGVELGTVPVAPNGSFYVEVPADRALAIQMVDGEGRPVISETSWLYVRPGETLSCVGCHNNRTSAPKANDIPTVMRHKPAKLVGRGTPHRFRANNAGNGGMLNLQYDRFREAGAINLYDNIGPAGKPFAGSLKADVERLCDQIAEGNDDQVISAIQALGVIRDRAAVISLTSALIHEHEEVRTAAALALSACGDRTAVKPLLEALMDPSPHVAQAANIALENLTGTGFYFNAYTTDMSREEKVVKWNEYLAQNNFSTLEKRAISRLGNKDRADTQKAIETLGHIGAEDAKKALRDFVKKNIDGDLRLTMATMRSLGYLQDTEAVDMLLEIFRDNMNKNPGAAQDLHELGWLQKPVYLAATAAEALGWIGTDKAETGLVDAMPKLLQFWDYTFRCGDHSWLMGCHSSPIHYRMIEAFDRMETSDLDKAVATILKSVPIDTDRALLVENDTYENLTARVIARSGRANTVLDTCLAILGDEHSVADKKLIDAVTASPPAVSVLPQDPKSRAAQIASVVCLDPAYAWRFRNVYNRYRQMEVSRERAWVCFFLARLLGKVGDPSSVDSLIASLADDAKEADFGFENPPNVFIYKAMTPFYRIAAADALGRIGDKRAIPVLLETVQDFDNAIGVRHAAAGSLVRLCDETSAGKLRQLAQDYPEIATRRLLITAYKQALNRQAKQAVSLKNNK